jgi:hypothetical protein
MLTAAYAEATNTLAYFNSGPVAQQFITLAPTRVNV